jgi:hypothetical protein
MSAKTSEFSVVKLEGATTVTGGYIEFPIVDLSYYPNERLYDRVKTTIYGANPTQSGRFQKASDEERLIPAHRPLSHTKVEGRFILFISTNERPWGMMEISELKPKERQPSKAATSTPRKNMIIQPMSLKMYIDGF